MELSRCNKEKRLQRNTC